MLPNDDSYIIAARWSMMALRFLGKWTITHNTGRMSAIPRMEQCYHERHQHAGAVKQRSHTIKTTFGAFAIETYRAGLPDCAGGVDSTHRWIRLLVCRTHVTTDERDIDGCGLATFCHS